MDALLVMGGGPGEAWEKRVESVEEALEWAKEHGFNLLRAKKRWSSEGPDFAQYGTDYYYLCVTS